MVKYFSMFSGIGGFELGIQRALDNKQSTQIKQNWERWNRNTNESEVCVLPSNNTPLCVGYSEIDKYAIQIYEKQFRGHKNYGDATKIIPEQIPEFDILVGGFPCQAFSIAGKRRGFEDTRGTLFFDIARIIKTKQPRLFLLENVKGLLNHDKGETFTTILKTIDELGYNAEWQVLNSKHYGVPQNRERVFIIGHLRGTSTRQVFPIFPCSTKVNQFCNTIKAGYYKQGYDNPVIKFKNSTIRRLTPIECERLQGFPDNWTEGLSDTQRYKTLGNAVTVNVIEAIVTKLIRS